MYSDESDWSDYEPRPKRKKKPHIELDSSSNESAIIGKKKRKIRIESSDSDSESSMENVVIKRKSARIISDSDSSDSEIIVRKFRTGAPLANDSTDSSSSDDEWHTDISDYNGSRISRNVTASAHDKTSELPNEDKGMSSDCSDGQSEKCPICLLSFKKQEIASPDSCGHIFCAQCIEEWSKNVNTCPVDRQPFQMILVRKTINEKVIRQIPVQVKERQIENEEISFSGLDNVFCEICGSDQNEESLLLCDSCDLGYHLACLEPPLEEVPEGEWFCPSCAEPDFVFHLNLDLNFHRNARSRTGSRRQRNNDSRLIPRTRQNERIIRRIRQQRTRTDRSPEVVFDDYEITDPDFTVVRRKKKCKNRKRKRQAYKVIYKVDEITGETIQIKTKRKRKRKSKKQKLRERRAVVIQHNVKARLAAHLGICNSQRENQMLPDVTATTSGSSNINFRRSQAGIPRLHLFGCRDELDYFSSEPEVENVSLDKDESKFNNTSNKNIPKTKVPANISQSDSVDILGSILESQSKLHSKNSIMTVERDGKIKIDAKECHSQRDNPDSNKDPKVEGSSMMTVMNNKKTNTVMEEKNKISENSLADLPTSNTTQTVKVPFVELLPKNTTQINPQVEEQVAIYSTSDSNSSNSDTLTSGLTTSNVISKAPSVALQQTAVPCSSKTIPTYKVSANINLLLQSVSSSEKENRKNNNQNNNLFEQSPTTNIKKSSTLVAKTECFAELKNTSELLKSSAMERTENKEDKYKHLKENKRKMELASYTGTNIFTTNMDGNGMKMPNELPSSTFGKIYSEFLAKANLQEKVEEIVKLILKPFYIKKHITKEEYKDIMRHTVPKFCHGEVDAKKIQSFVESYMRKVQQKRTLQNSLKG